MQQITKTTSPTKIGDFIKNKKQCNLAKLLEYNTYPNDKRPIINKPTYSMNLFFPAKLCFCIFSEKFEQTTSLNPWKMMTKI